MESFGAMGPKAEEFLKEIKKTLEVNLGIKDATDTINLFKHTLSTGLQRINIRSIINNSYNPYHQGTVLKYNPDIKKIKLFEKLLENISIISDYTPIQIEKLKLNIELYYTYNKDIIDIVKRRNLLFDLLKIMRFEF